MADFNFDYYQYKQKINKPKNFTLTILVCFMIIFSFLYTYIKPINNLEFYFIEIDKFSNYEDAINYTIKKQQNENILCYIYFDNYYHVLTNFYSNLKQAKQHLKFSSTSENEKILTITAPKISHKKDFTKEQNILTKSIFYEFKKLNKLSSTNRNLNIQNTCLDIENFIKKFDDFIENFSIEFKNFPTLNSVKKSLVKIQNYLQNILDYSNENFISNLNFQITQIAMEEIKFLNYF